MLCVFLASCLSGLALVRVRPKRVRIYGALAIFCKPIDPTVVIFIHCKFPLARLIFVCNFLILDVDLSISLLIKYRKQHYIGITIIISPLADFWVS